MDMRNVLRCYLCDKGASIHDAHQEAAAYTEQQIRGLVSGDLRTALRLKYASSGALETAGLTSAQINVLLAPPGEAGHSSSAGVAAQGVAGPYPASVAVQRAKYAGRYVGHDAEKNPVTVLTPRWLVTHAHGTHAKWTKGTKVKVWLNDLHADHRSKVSATVAFNSGSPQEDYVLLRVKDSVWGQRETPVLDAAVHPFAPYVLVGASARSQTNPTSTRHSSVLSTHLDRNCHMKGDTPPEKGNSGGGCFLLDTGALFAIDVARSNGQSALLPITVPFAKSQELEKQEKQKIEREAEQQKQMHVGMKRPRS